MVNRDEVRDFLTTRRARLTPEMVGLPVGTRRRVRGLRREEVAVLAGISTDWYVRLEKGHIAEVSADVLNAVAAALRLSADEHDYLCDLARSARNARHAPVPRAPAALEPHVQWMLDSVTGSAVHVRNRRLDIIATNALGRALHSPLFDSPTAVDTSPNFACFFFLDDASRDYFVDWEGGAAATVALLRAQTARKLEDGTLGQLVAMLRASSEDFRRLWADHDVRVTHEGVKRLRHPRVGQLEVVYQSTLLPPTGGEPYELSFYTPQPGTAHAQRLQQLLG